MCWNQHVSLNTFLFSIFVLLLVIYNNQYTPYKLKTAHTLYQYLFLLSFITMQLLEFFAWRNMKDPYYNLFISFLISLLLFIQPIVSLFLLENQTLRNKLIGFYLLFSLGIFLFEIVSWREKTWSQIAKSISISVSPTGHLRWKSADHPVADNVAVFVWMCFFMFSFFYNGNIGTILFALSLFAASIYGYYKDGSYKSMWCWVVNSVFIYFAFYLLLLAPFWECYRS